jgi:predicted aspartyl protease
LSFLNVRSRQMLVETGVSEVKVRMTAEEAARLGAALQAHQGQDLEAVQTAGVALAASARVAHMRGEAPMGDVPPVLVGEWWRIEN